MAWDTRTKNGKGKVSFLTNKHSTYVWKESKKKARRLLMIAVNA